MAKIVINKNRCKGCLLCIAECPVGCIAAGVKINGSGCKPVEFIRQERCIACALCYQICPDCAIEVYK